MRRASMASDCSGFSTDSSSSEDSCLSPCGDLHTDTQGELVRELVARSRRRSLAMRSAQEYGITVSVDQVVSIENSLQMAQRMLSLQDQGSTSSSPSAVRRTASLSPDPRPTNTSPQMPLLSPHSPSGRSTSPGSSLARLLLASPSSSSRGKQALSARGSRRTSLSFAIAKVEDNEITLPSTAELASDNEVATLLTARTACGTSGVEITDSVSESVEGRDAQYDADSEEDEDDFLPTAEKISLDKVQSAPSSPAAPSKATMRSRMKLNTSIGESSSSLPLANGAFLMSPTAAPKSARKRLSQLTAAR